MCQAPGRVLSKQTQKASQDPVLWSRRSSGETGGVPEALELLMSTALGEIQLRDLRSVEGDMGDPCIWEFGQVSMRR